MTTLISDKVGKYYRDATERTQRKKSPWNWILLPLTIVGISSVYFFIFKGLLEFQRYLIPANVILSGGTRLGRVLMVAPPFFLALTLGFMFANFIAWCIPPARRALDKEASGIKGASFEEAMKMFAMTSIILLIIVMPLSFLGVFNYFYVADSGVTTRPLFSLQEKHYEWNDIVRIHAECSIERNSFFWDYILYMKDGKKVDLLEETRLDFIKAYDKIKPFIRTQKHIKYDYKIGDKEIERLRRNYSQDAEKIIRIIRNE